MEVLCEVEAMQGPRFTVLLQAAWGRNMAQPALRFNLGMHPHLPPASVPLNKELAFWLDLTRKPQVPEPAAPPPSPDAERN